MGNLAISVSNLSKKYVIGANKDKSFSLVETIVDGCREPFQNLKRLIFSENSLNQKEFWALRDISFEVRHGEVLGIIGRNGAGKSTLLKILSRVLQPTMGRCVLYGRCGSLLEVGMGFHPELTGRENIYLNGAILGLRKVEIDKKLEAIIDFSGVEKFIDTPVKRYSSGMYIRLAFSVAAQLDPEILIIDEVLAVGDEIFQKKCLKRMHEVAREGRTVLFVSHSMHSIRTFCGRALLLGEGRLIADGAADDVVDQYLDLVSENLKEATEVEKLADIPIIIDRLPPDPVFRLKDLAIVQAGQPTLDVVNGIPIHIRTEYEVLHDTKGFFLFFRLLNNSGSIVFESIHNGDAATECPTVMAGRYISTAEIPGDFLAPVPYELWIGAAIHGERACLPEMIKFSLSVTPSGQVNRAYPQRRIQGELAPLISWNTERLDRFGLPVQNLGDILSLPALPGCAPVAEQVWENPDVAPGNDKFRFRAVRILDGSGRLTANIDSQEPFDVEIEYWNLKEGTSSGTGLTIWNSKGVRILTSGNNRDPEWHGQRQPRGIVRSTCHIPGNFFGKEYFTISFYIWAYGYGEVTEMDGVLSFNVYESKDSYRGDYLGEWPTVVCPVFQWTNKLMDT